MADIEVRDWVVDGYLIDEANPYELIMIVKKLVEQTPYAGSSWEKYAKTILETNLEDFCTTVTDESGSERLIIKSEQAEALFEFLSPAKSSSGERIVNFVQKPEDIANIGNLRETIKYWNNISLEDSFPLIHESLENVVVAEFLKEQFSELQGKYNDAISERDELQARLNARSSLTPEQETALRADLAEAQRRVGELEAQATEKGFKLAVGRLKNWQKVVVAASLFTLAAATVVFPVLYGIEKGNNAELAAKNAEQAATLAKITEILNQHGIDVASFDSFEDAVRAAFDNLTATPGLDQDQVVEKLDAILTLTGGEPVKEGEDLFGEDGAFARAISAVDGLIASNEQYIGGIKTLTGEIFTNLTFTDQDGNVLTLDDFESLTDALKYISEHAVSDGLFEALQQEIADKEATIATLTEAKTKLEAEKKVLEADKTQLEADKAQLQADKTQLEADKAQLQADKTQLEADKTQLEADKAQLQADKAQLQADKTQLEADKAQLQAENSELSGRDYQAGGSTVDTSEQGQNNVPVASGEAEEEASVPSKIGEVTETDNGYVPGSGK